MRDIKVGREDLWEFEPTQLEGARRALELLRDNGITHSRK